MYKNKNQILAATKLLEICTDYMILKEMIEEENEKVSIAAKAYTFSEVSELQALVTAMTGECKAIYVPSDNTVAKNDSIVGTICNEKNVPVYTSYGGAVCYASLSIDYYELGAKTGEMAAEILLNGQVIGYMGDSGIVTGVHLHFGIIKNGGYVNPANYMYFHP